MKRSSTCLAVLRDKDKSLWFAGDRRVSYGNCFQKAPAPKVINREGILLGECGLSVISDLIIRQFDLPSNSYNATPIDYIHKLLLPEFMDWLRHEGWVAENSRVLKKEFVGEHDLQEDFAASVLIGVESELFDLHLSTTSIGIDHMDAPYAAGCGGELALGSLLTTEKMDLTVKQRLKMAVTVAAKANSGCDNHVDIVTNKGNK